MSTQTWQDAFLAISAVLGEPIEDSLACIGEGRTSRWALATSLQAPSRDVRARGLARAVAAVLTSLDEMRLR